MRRGVGTLTAAVLLGSVLAGESAADGRRVLRVTAPRSAYVDVRVTREIVMDLDHATYRGGRAYMAFVLDRLDDGPDEMLAARFPAVEAQPGVVGTLGRNQRENPLPPGTYRLYALSDGSVDFTIRVSGMARDVHLRPSRPVTPRYRFAEIPQAFDPTIGNPYGGKDRIPGAIGDLAILRFGAEFRPGAYTVEGYDFCTARPGEDCTNPTGLDAYRFAPRNPGSRFDAMAYLPREVFVGELADVFGKCRAVEPAVFCRMAVLDRYVTRVPSRGAVPI